MYSQSFNLLQISNADVGYNKATSQSSSMDIGIVLCNHHVPDFRAYEALHHEQYKLDRSQPYGIEILAGSMFGIVLGALLCVIGKTIGQLFAFLAASFFGKNRISIYMKTNFPTFAALTVVLQNSNWKVLLLIQVANVPHLVKCFGLAITDISTYKFAVSSALGGLPYAILWTYIGYHSKNLIAHDEAVTLSNTSFQDRILIGAGGTILTILGMWWLMVYTKKQLRIELLQVKHLHSTGINSTDKCITIVSS
ncbi:Predicted membrane protein [Plasmopara halstedii]|uniref:Predicted membrane protein n=1 Tax=Plasmopara halstedii TaxID=4781 RepID=A0A0P1AGK7_PLAHL|nr:Predicted membrane protein [Plasmopara halstedii]CEG39606.1 Predicted membrane protein [Plasmopara halstedii]|eukprot:XP_024575975.1 Predicted membrane protein [Plasmopara halstedii]